VEAPHLSSRSSDRAKGGEIHRVVGRAGGDRHCFPPAHATAARRLSLRPGADHSASDAILAASLPATSRDLPVAQVEGEASSKRKFNICPIGFFHIEIAEVRTEQGKLYLFVAIDRTSKFAFVE
jgi:hypothetical protein